MGWGVVPQYVVWVVVDTGTCNGGGCATMEAVAPAAAMAGDVATVEVAEEVAEAAATAAAAA